MPNDADIEAALTAATTQYGRQLIEELRPHVYHNIHQGYGGESIYEPNGLLAYIHKIAQLYILQKEYVVLIMEKGDQQAWQTLSEKMYKWAYRFLYKKAVPPDQIPHLACEIVQEAYLAMWGKTFHYHTEFEAWVHAFVINIGNNHKRHYFSWNGRTADPLDEEASDSNKLSVEEILMTEEGSNTLANQIARLTVDEQTLIEMRYVENKSFIQIAAHLGCQVNTAHQRHFRILNKLAGWLRQNGIDPLASD